MMVVKLIIFREIPIKSSRSGKIAAGAPTAVGYSMNSTAGRTVMDRLAQPSRRRRWDWFQTRLLHKCADIAYHL